MLWLTAYLMGLPPTGLYTLCWTHGQTPMWSMTVCRVTQRQATRSLYCHLKLPSTPKYRRKVAYGKIKQDIANILSMLCKRKGVKIVEAEICPDYVHMLVEIPPSISVSYFVGYLKGKSTLMIFESHANLKYKYGNRHFWCRGYYVDAMEKMRRKYRNI